MSTAGTPRPTSVAPPRVSIAIPVYNGARTIRACLESALAQTYEQTEIVIVDNASTDETVAIVESYDDPRIRLHRNPRNLGFQRNTNRSIELSSGEFVKPLHADDRLLPGCVERMLELFEAHERVGLVFAPRQIELSHPTDAGQRQWLEVYGRPDRNFSSLQRVNDGRSLLREWLRGGIADNWVGEPSSMMLRRSSLERVGLVNLRVGTLSDVDLTVRLMVHYDIGFLDEELSVFRRAYGGLTDEIHADSWLDPLWVLEGLAADAATRAPVPVPELAPVLARERRNVARQLLRTGRRRPAELPARARQFAGYAAFAARRAVGRPPRLHPPLGSIGG